MTKLRSLLVMLATAALPVTNYFLYQRPITGASATTSQSCVTLPVDIFTHAAPQLADLRLYQGDTETPYEIRVATAVEALEKIITPANLGRRGNSTVFDGAMPEGTYSDVTLDIAAQNFLATVTVSGNHAQAGPELHGYETKLGSYTIFDLTDQKLGRSTVLHLPESDFRYLHFSVAGPLTPEKMTGLSVERLPASEPKYLTVAASSQIKMQGHVSLIELTVPAHIPVDRLVFSPAAEPIAFTRDVKVSVSPLVPTIPAADVEPALEAKSSANLLRLHRMEAGHRIDEERLTVEAPAHRFDSATKWTIEIENGTDLPLKMQSVRLEMLERRLCFQSSAHARYALFYGDPALDAPHYDYAALFAPQSNAVQLSVGAEAHNPAYQPRPDDRPFTERHPALLWAALIAVIGLLASIALRTSKSQ